MAQNYNLMSDMYPTNMGSLSSPSSPSPSPSPQTSKDLDFLFATVNSNGGVSLGGPNQNNQNNTPSRGVSSPLAQPQPQPQIQTQAQNSPGLVGRPPFIPHPGYYSNNNTNNHPYSNSNSNSNPIEFFESPSFTASNSARSPVVDLDFNASPPTQVATPNGIPLNNNGSINNNVNTPTLTSNLNRESTAPPTLTTTTPELNVQVLQIGRIIQMLEILSSTSSQVLNKVEGMEGRLSSLETSMKEILTNQRSLNMQLKDTETPMKKPAVNANNNVSNTIPPTSSNNNNNINNTNTPISTPPQLVQASPTPGPYQMGYFPPMMGMPPMMPISGMPGQLVPVTHIKEPGVLVSNGGDNYSSDLELAKKLQASFDSMETPPQPKPVSRPVAKDLQECPMCSLKFPIGELESHVAGHFEEDLSDRPLKKEEPKSQPSFFSKLFSKNEDEKKTPPTTTTTPPSNTNANTPTPVSASNTPSSTPNNNLNVNRPASTSLGASTTNTNAYRQPALPNPSNTTPSYPGSYPRNQYYYQPPPMQQYLYPSPYSQMGDQQQHQ